MTESLLGTKIGHVRFVDKIATGGMGEVYAGYDETLERKVALKGIRQEFHLSEEAKGRFLREARVLSQLGHPNICQIYDYIEGSESDFIVMELVEGRSLAKAMKKGLSPQAKMRIAEQVAGVLVAAHEKGVIHRDLKPDNVMLTEEGQVKVLDFGLSRQMVDEATRALPLEGPPELKIGEAAALKDDRTLGLAEESGHGPVSGLHGYMTTAGTIMGTIGYMSPEQARGEVVMAASDMYSFGLLLQELFTGKPPIDPGLDLAARLEKAKKGETLPVGGLDSDLEALINRLKSLAPGARPSAEDTVQRLAWIREKPLRRRKKLLLSVAAAALVVFSVAMTIQSIRATRAERRAREEAETAKQVSEFLTNIFKVSDPSEARGRTVTAREILDAGAKRIGEELKGQPLVQARLLDTMGNVYIGLGLYKEAEPLLQSALDLREKNLSQNSLEVADALNNLVILYVREGRYAEAEPLAKRALEIRESALGHDDPRVAKSLNVIATLCLNQGKYADAEPLYKRALTIQEKAFGPDDSSVAEVLHNLGLLYFWQGKYAEAEPLYQQALSIWERSIGPDHPNVANCLISLAAICEQQGKHAEAQPLLTRALAIQEKVLGPDHPNLAASLINLGGTCFNQGKYAETEPLYKRALAIQEKALGPEHPEVAMTLCVLANLYLAQGKYAEAEHITKRAVAIDEKALGPNHPDVARSLNYLVVLYLNEGQVAQAEPLCRQELSIAEKALGPDHPDVAMGLSNLATMYFDEGKYTEAEPLYSRCLAIREKALGQRNLDTVGSVGALARCQMELKKLDDALANSGRCIKLWRELAVSTPEDIGTRSLLGSALLLDGQIKAAMGKSAEGQCSWKEALAILQHISKDAQDVNEQAVYAEVLLCLGKTDEAKPIVKKVLATGYKNPDLSALCREKGL